MKQQTIYKKGIVCGNRKFYYCDVDVNTHKCINCDKQFNDGLNDGDIIVGECKTCGKTDRRIKILFMYKNGGVVGECMECVKIWEPVEDLFEAFRWEGYGWDEEKFSNEKFTKDMEAGVEAIASLPKESLKAFLRAIHGVVER